mmetsp:Transcript_49006/g.111658  ORF Transcript_49006/g.111658 Transcript_49006/m.111658 type:complete len:258 (-) Transcript_49006:881-1654(-)
MMHLVGQALEVDRSGRDLLLRGVISVGEVTTAGQVQTHDARVRRQEGRIDRKVGGAPGVRLHIDAPLLLIKAESLEGTVLAEVLDLVDDLVATVVARTGLPLRVLVGERGPEALHHRPGSKVLRSNELDGTHLPGLLLLHQCAHSGVRLTQGPVPGERRAGAASGDALRGDHELGVGIAIGTEDRGLLGSDELEPRQHAHDDLFEVQGVEVQAGCATLEAGLAHGDAELSAPGLEGVVACVSGSSRLHHAGGQARLA